MYLTKKTKETLFKKHGKNEKDTVSYAQVGQGDSRKIHIN